MIIYTVCIVLECRRVENTCSCIATLASSQRLAPNCLVLIFPAGTARAEDPAASRASEAAEAVPAESERRNEKR